jgi:hypothetical protein
MNEDLSRLKQMLEEVTAAEAPAAGSAPVEQGDAESASLREAWLAFGQLIRAADASLPAMPEVLPVGVPALAGKPHGFRLKAGLQLIAATAAALLIAISCGWWIGRDGKQDNRKPSLAHSTTPGPATSRAEIKTATPAVLPKQDLPKAAAAQAEEATNKQPKAGAAKTSTWDDPLETQIAAVSQQIRNVQQNWRYRVDDVDLVQYRIDKIADSLQNDKL